MSYRNPPEDLGRLLEEMQRKIRALEQARFGPPDPNWVLREVDGGLYVIYVPTGSAGPQIGVR